jgi:hypothetical protein
MVLNLRLGSFAMTGRPLMVATLLGASIGVPYAVSHTSKQMNGAASPATAGSSNWSGSHSQSPFTSSPMPYASSPSLGQTTPVSNHGTAAGGPSGAGTLGQTPGGRTHYSAIQQVFRFDLSREWIYQNWDRKSTGLGDPSMYGIRVPLVTGTGMTDLAGSLTYDFNAQGQVEHIAFRGRTADTTAIVQYLVQTYRFQRMEAPAGEQLYQVRSGNDVYSEFRSRPEPVLNTNSPHGSFAVVIELGRPGLNRPLVPQTPKLEVPPAPPSATPPQAAASAEAAGAEGTAERALVGKVRPATPAEEAQVMQRRWPN